jgi:hypothetical protein
LVELSKLSFLLLNNSPISRVEGGESAESEDQDFFPSLAWPSCRDSIFLLPNTHRVKINRGCAQRDTVGVDKDLNGILILVGVILADAYLIPITRIICNEFKSDFIAGLGSTDSRNG